MTATDHRNEPERLDAHRAARGSDGSDATAPADPPEGDAPPPASFEESAAVQRARKIEELRDAVDSGDYHPDPGRIAESMLENERT